MNLPGQSQTCSQEGAAVRKVRYLVIPALLLCILLLIVSCAKVPVTGRKQFLLITEAAIVHFET